MILLFNRFSLNTKKPGHASPIIGGRWFFVNTPWFQGGGGNGGNEMDMTATKNMASLHNVL